MLAKPVRSHFAIVQQLDTNVDTVPSAAAQASSYRREDLTAAYDGDTIFARLLQTEDGEPIQLVDGSLIEETA